MYGVLKFARQPPTIRAKEGAGASHHAYRAVATSDIAPMDKPHNRGESRKAKDAALSQRDHPWSWAECHCLPSSRNARILSQLTI